MTLGMVRFLKHDVYTFTCKGTKSVAKAMKKIAQGAAKWEGTKWFRDLSDTCMRLYMYNHVLALRTVTSTLLFLYTGKSTKTHMYWATKNCGGDGAQLRSDILNVVQHYQVSNTCTCTCTCNTSLFFANT